MRDARCVAIASDDRPSARRRSVLAQTLDLATFSVMVARARRQRRGESDRRPEPVRCRSACRRSSWSSSSSSTLVAALALAAAGHAATAELWAMVGGLPLAVAIAAGLIGGITNAATYLALTVGHGGRVDQNTCSNRVDIRVDFEPCPRISSSCAARANTTSRTSRRVPARPARRHHRPVADRGKSQPRLRHDLRRGPAALRREPERLRPPVPRPDGEAGRRPDRRPVAGHLDRPEGRVAQPALDGRDGHRDLRPPAAAVRADRHPALPQRPRRSSARPSSRSSTRCWPCRRAPGCSSSAPLIKDRKTEGDRIFDGARRQGFVRVRVDGETVRHRGRTQARQVQAPLDRGRRRPLHRPPRRGARGRDARAGRPADRPRDRARSSRTRMPAGWPIRSRRRSGSARASC